MFEKPLSAENDLFRVLNHGDIWVNNIMFKKQNDKPIDLKFVSRRLLIHFNFLFNVIFYISIQIDFQLSFYTSPGYDLNYFLVMSPNLETRTTREEEFLEAYREEFNTKLREFNYNKDFTLSQELLQQVFKDKAIHGFNMMLTTLPAFLRPSKQHSSESVEMFTNEIERKKAMREIIQSDLYVKYLRFHLKKFNRMGVLDFSF